MPKKPKPPPKPLKGLAIKMAHMTKHMKGVKKAK
jgi:hypothetical protein